MIYGYTKLFYHHALGVSIKSTLTVLESRLASYVVSKEQASYHAYVCKAIWKNQ